MTTDRSPALIMPAPARQPGRVRRTIPAVAILAGAILAGATLAAAILGGCAALPGAGPPTGLLAADPSHLDPSSRPINVLPVDGLATLAQSDQFAEIMAQALRDRNLAAGVRGTSAASLFLAGRAITIADADLPPDSPHFLSIDWTVVDSDGNPVAEHRQQVRVAPGRWAVADPDLLLTLSVAAADAVAIMLGDPGPKDDAVSTALRNIALRNTASADAPIGVTKPGATKPGVTKPGADAPSMTVGVLAVSGAPGSGNEALTVAMTIALTRRRLTVLDPPDNAALVIAGTVEVGPPDNGTQAVEIVWRVRQPGGEVVGRIAQANRVPAGSLGGSWRPIAPVVADGAADGLIDLIRQVADDVAGNADREPTGG